MRVSRILARVTSFAVVAAVIGMPLTPQAAPLVEIEAKLALGLEMSVIPTPVTEALEAALDSTALAQWFCDPETCHIRTNYQTAVKPVVPGGPAVTVESLTRGFNGPVTKETAALMSSVMKAELLIASDELAIRETLHRRYTAESRKDQKATGLQNMTLESFIRKTASDKAEANGMWSKLAAHLKAAGIDSKPGDAARTLADIKKNGFPRGEMAIYTQLGLSAADIRQMQEIVVKSTDLRKVPKSFVAAIPGIMQINESNTAMQQCRCAPPAR